MRAKQWLRRANASPKSVSALGRLIQFFHGAPLTDELADTGKVLLQRLLKIFLAERLRRLDQSPQIAARSVGEDQRRGAAVVDPDFCKRGVVWPLPHLQIDDKLVDDLGF